MALLENKKQLLLIAFAVVAGVIAAAIVGNWVTETVNKKTQDLQEQYTQQQKQMASELQQRSEQQVAALRQEMASVQQQQQQAMKQATEAAMKAAQQQAMATQAAAQVALRAAKEKHSSSLLTAKTPAGKRAITVMIDSLSAVGGLLNPGDYVDVIAHLDVPQNVEGKKTITAMVFQDLQVLAINANLDNSGAYEQQQNTGALKITFAVDPQEAGLLVFANKNGKLELALRAPNENDKQTVQASTWKTLADYVLQNQGSSFEIPSDEAQKKDKPKAYIQIFRGGKEL